MWCSYHHHLAGEFLCHPQDKNVAPVISNPTLPYSPAPTDLLCLHRSACSGHGLSMGSPHSSQVAVCVCLFAQCVFSVHQAEHAPASFLRPNNIVPHVLILFSLLNLSNLMTRIVLLIHVEPVKNNNPSTYGWVNKMWYYPSLQYYLVTSPRQKPGTCQPLFPVPPFPAPQQTLIYFVLTCILDVFHPLVYCTSAHNSQG